MNTDISRLSLPKRENIGWIDMLRILAAFLVVFAHCGDGFVAQFDSDRASFLTGVWAGSLMRPSVPLFVMMTAVLLLPLKASTDTIGFYRKRIGRIVVPLIFWSLMLPAVDFIYFHYVNPDTANPLIDTSAYTPATLLRRMYTCVFNFNADTVPLWYLYMLAGLYLVMPLINPWLERATRREIKIILALWGVTLLLPYLQMAAPFIGYEGNYGNMGLLGLCDWNPYGSLYYLSGFIGYILLAYYLTRWPLQWSLRKLTAVMLPMFVAGYLITALGYLWFQEYFPGNYAYLEIVWYFCGINVLMMTFPVFALASRLSIKSRPWLSRMASLAFGVYLCHYPLTFITYDLFDIASWPYIARIAAMAITTFAVSLGVVRLLSLWAPTRRLIR